MDEKEGPGLWTIPGGKVDPKDWGRPCPQTQTYTGVLERAVRREIYEETGLTELGTLSQLPREALFIRADGTPTLVIRFRALLEDLPRNIMLSKDFIGCAWVTKNALETMHYPCIGNVKDELRALLS